jgi:phosphatidylinositol alpha-1,6-mannosyltransferase
MPCPASGYRFAAQDARKAGPEPAEMRVLALVTDGFGGFGGIAQYNRDLLTALAQCTSIEGIVVLPRYGAAEPIALPNGVRQLEPKAGKLPFTLAVLRTTLTEGPFHAVFCGHLHLAPVGAMLARVMGVPLWLQLHGIEVWKPMGRMQRWSAEQATLVTAVSRHTRRRFMRCASIDPSRVRVLPNTFGARFARGPKPDYLLDRYHLRGTSVLLTVGRLADTERYKGHDEIIQVLPRLVEKRPDVIYLVIGEGNDRARLEEMVRRLGLQHHVLFLGMIEQHELPDYYRLADVFVMPSTQEGFGIVFLEAAASGLRLIGGNCDGGLDALADGAIGFAIDPASSDELLSAINAALAGDGPDPTQVERFGTNNFAELVCELTRAYLGSVPAERVRADQAFCFRTSGGARRDSA